MVAISWTVSCIEPSPTKSRTRRGMGDSCAARSAPSVAPTLYPMLDHRVWLTRVAPLGKGVVRRPNELQPTSATMMSFSRRKLPTRGHKSAFVTGSFDSPTGTTGVATARGRSGGGDVLRLSVRARTGRRSWNEMASYSAYWTKVQDEWLRASEARVRGVRRRVEEVEEGERATHSSTMFLVLIRVDQRPVLRSLRMAPTMMARSVFSTASRRSSSESWAM